MYLSTCTPHSFGQDTILAIHSSSCAAKSLCGISVPQDGHFTIRYGQLIRCWASSHWYARRMQPLSLNLHSTAFMSHTGRWLAREDTGPVQQHPPGWVSVDVHLNILLPMASSTARFLTSSPLRLLLSTGQQVLFTCHSVMHSLQNEWSSWQVTGWLKTPQLKKKGS